VFADVLLNLPARSTTENAGKVIVRTINQHA
jgi:hypothetical protein